MEADDDDFDVPQPEEAETRDKGSGRGKGRGRGGGKGRGSSNKAKTCFAQGCQEKVRAHSKFCQTHHKDVEAMKYQAKVKDPKAFKVLEDVLADPAKTAMALDDFSKENPGGRFRKKLIDWTSFTQKFGKRAEVRMRGTEELMDVSDFVAWQRSRGKSEEESMQLWKEHLESDLEREGEGATVKLWIVRNKQRYKDTIHYKDEGMEEGSKPVKDISDSDRPVFCENFRKVYLDVSGKGFCLIHVANWGQRELLGRLQILIC